MQGPDFTYLTNNYVEALGLEPFLYAHKDLIYVDVAIAPGVKLLNVPMVGRDFAVVYNHCLYFREPDGLAWTRRT